jgi:hypothetical protein
MHGGIGTPDSVSKRGVVVSRNLGRALAAVTFAALAVSAARAQTVVTIGIGTQDTTTTR